VKHATIARIYTHVLPARRFWIHSKNDIPWHRNGVRITSAQHLSDMSTILWPFFKLHAKHITYACDNKATAIISIIIQTPFPAIRESYGSILTPIWSEMMEKGLAETRPSSSN
jgi:hypothetical protein